MKLDIPTNRVFRDPGIGRKDFQNLSPLIFLRVSFVNHRIRVGDNLDRVAAAWTANPDSRMKREGFQLLEIESERINTMRTIEERNRNRHGTALDELVRRNGEHDYSSSLGWQWAFPEKFRLLVFALSERVL